MKLARLCLLLGLLLCSAGRVRADLTIVQKVDGVGEPGALMTVRIKGDMARIDATPKISTIVDGKTGEIVTLMKDQKTVVRISADRMKAAAEMINKFSDKKASTPLPKPTPTGRRETVNGYEAEEYIVDSPMFKAAYWVAPKFPESAAILKQLQALKPEIWNSARRAGPDYRDFPALPVKTVVEVGRTKVTTTLVSVSQDALSDADFAVPKDFQEVKTPDIGNMLQPGRAWQGSKASPHP